jgi:hypothetical protein
MTGGLLVSRRTKLTLQKKSLAVTTVANISAFKSYRNTYNRVLRASKKMYFDSNLKKSKKNPKKTWALLKMAIGNPPKRAKIEKIAVENDIISSPSKIASIFNDFFAGVPRKIVNQIPKTDVSPLSFLPPNNFFGFIFTTSFIIIRYTRKITLDTGFIYFNAVQYMQGY